MSALLLLVACLALGTAAARWLQPPIGMAQALNWWVINIALPALILDLIPHVDFEPQLWFLAASQYLVFAGAWALFAFLGPRLGWNRQRTGAIILMSGLGNTAFVGYPMLEALHGRDGLSLGVIADQLGCFVVLAIGGVLVCAWYSGARPQPREVLRRIALFPPFLALVAGVLVGIAGGWPAWFEPVLARLGATLSPLALFSVGLRLKFQLGEDHLRPMLLAFGWKMLLAPLAMLGLGLAFGVSGLALTITVLQAAMGPMVSAAILADQHRMEPALANSILGIGILVSLLTVPLWNQAIA